MPSPAAFFDAPVCSGCKGKPPRVGRCLVCNGGPPKHLCHARGCNVGVPPRMLMCLPHWRKVPVQLQREVNRWYVPGQEIRKDPTPVYLNAASAAIDAVAMSEGQ